MGEESRRRSSEGRRQRVQDANMAAEREVERIKELEQRAWAREARSQLARKAQLQHDKAAIDAQVEKDVAAQRILESLRAKDDDLEKTTRRLEAALAEQSGTAASLASAKNLIIDLEAKLASADQVRHKETTRANDLQAELSRVKGLLADAQFDLELTEKKYSRLLDSTAIDLKEKDLQRKRSLLYSSPNPFDPSSEK